MRYFTAIISGLFIFVAVFLIVSLILAFITPGLAEVHLNIGLIEGNLIGLIAFLLSTIAATMTFKASLHAKTGRLYTKKTAEDKKQTQ